MRKSLNSSFSPLSILFCVLSAVLISITVYHYGTGNHAVIVPFLKVTMNPDLYPNDYFVMQSEYYHTFLWDVMAILIENTGISVEWLFFILYLVCMTASALAIYGISLTLFENTKVALLSVFIQLVYFIHNAGVGDEFLMDHLLKESQVALPLLLFAMFHFLNGNYKRSYFLMGLGFLIHPLSSIYVIVILSVPLFIVNYPKDLKKLVAPLLILVIVSVPLLIRKLQHSPESMHMFEVYLDWVNMLRNHYAGHSFPFSWSIWKYLKASILIGLFLYSWKYKPNEQLHSVIRYGTYTIFVLWILGVVFTELIPLPIIIQMQFFRSYTILSLFAVLYWANFFVKSIESDVPVWEKGLMLIATIAFIIMLPSEGNPIINEIHRSPGILWKNNYAYIVLFGLILIGFYKFLRKKMSILQWSMVLAALLLLIAARKVRKEGMEIASQLPEQWVDVQHWANSNSHLNDIFVVPPNMRGFRIDGERTIFGDFKDGIQMYFNPEFAYQWKKRMELLGVKNLSEDGLEQAYLSLSEENIKSISNDHIDTHPSTYMVSPKSRSRGLNFPVVYENDQYTVYKVR